MAANRVVAVLILALLCVATSEAESNRAGHKLRSMRRSRAGMLTDLLKSAYNEGKEITGELIAKADETRKKVVEGGKQLISEAEDKFFAGVHSLKTTVAGRMAPFTPNVPPAGQAAFDTIAPRHARYAFSSYCAAADLKTWTCPWCVKLCKGCVTQVTVNNGAQDLSSWTGVNVAEKEIIVAFRGTVPTSLANWLVDLHASKIVHPWGGKIPGEAKVHSGFFDGYNSMKSALIAQTKALIEKHKNFTVIITGHSLGGAMAIVCAADFKIQGVLTKNTKVHVTTFGEPRVGNTVFRNWMAMQFPSPYNNPAGATIWQFVYNLDLVPHVPFHDMNFSHCALWIWMKYAQGKNQYRICYGPKDPLCADSVPLPLMSTVDHSLYFNPTGEKLC